MIMFGDKMYCMNCGKIFRDTWTPHNTRTDNIISNCPFCMCMHTINASVLLEKGKHKYFKPLHRNEFVNMLRKKILVFNKKKFKRKKDIYYRRCELDEIRKENG